MYAYIYYTNINKITNKAPLFIAETSPNKLRGRLVSFKEAAIVIGIVAGYAAGNKLGNYRLKQKLSPSILMYYQLTL